MNDPMHCREVLEDTVSPFVFASGWAKCISQVREELAKANYNVQHVLENRGRDPETVENCLKWAQTAVRRAKTLLSEFVHIAAFFEGGEFMISELSVLVKASDDIRNAQTHADEPDVSAGFLRSAGKRIKNAMGIHGRLINAAQVPAGGLH
jgi:hypothetical protein